MAAHPHRLSVLENIEKLGEKGIEGQKTGIIWDLGQETDSIIILNWNQMKSKCIIYKIVDNLYVDFIFTDVNVNKMKHHRLNPKNSLKGWYYLN